MHHTEATGMLKPLSWQVKLILVHEHGKMLFEHDVIPVRALLPLSISAAELPFSQLAKIYCVLKEYPIGEWIVLPLRILLCYL